jgi:hypothetical protein
VAVKSSEFIFTSVKRTNLGKTTNSLLPGVIALKRVVTRNFFGGVLMFKDISIENFLAF